MNINTLIKFFAFAFSRVGVLAVVVIFVLTGCKWQERSSIDLTVGFTSKTAGASARVVSSSTLSRDTISSVYPSVGTVWLSVSSASYNAREINDDYNDGRFTMNADNTAFVLTDTVVDLNAPNTAPLTIIITAFNIDGYQVFTGQVTLTSSQLSAASVAVAVPMKSDIDDRIPVLATDPDCEDDIDGDGYCSIYEDLFVNALGIPDVDGDGNINSDDRDSDGDSVFDSADHNPAIGRPTPSNNGYPMFIIANRAPSVSDVSISVAQNASFTISLPASSIDPDVNDVVVFSIDSEPGNGTVVIDDTDIIYTPSIGYFGDDSFSVVATDLAGATDSFSVTVIVVNDELLSNFSFGDRRSTPGAAIPLNVLSDTEIELELTVISAQTDVGELFIPQDGSNIYFRTDSNETAAIATVTYEDSHSISHDLTISLHADLDGDGLSDAIATNYSAVLDTNATNFDTDADALSDYYEALSGNKSVSSLSGTEIVSDVTVPTVWTIENSPYYIADGRGLIAIESELIIEQGVEIKFSSGTSLAVYDTDGGNGRIVAWGGDSETLAVRFTHVDDTANQPLCSGDCSDIILGDWLGIEFSNTGENILANTRVFYARDGISIYAGSPIIDNTRVLHSSAAGLLLSTAGVPIVTDSVFANNQQGVRVQAVGDGFEITNAIIRDNYNDEVGAASNPTGNGGGIDIESAGTITVSNSLIVNNYANNLGVGIYSAGLTELFLSGNTFSNNSAVDDGSDGYSVYMEGGSGVVTAVGNLFYENQACPSGCLNHDIFLSSGTTVSGSSVGNVSDAGSVETELGAGNVTNTSASFVTNWYQDQSTGSNAAIDLLSDEVAELTYLARLTNPTTNEVGTIDSSSVDAGYHYNSALVSISSVDPATSSTKITIDGESGNSTQNLDVTFYDVNGRLIGADQSIYADFAVMNDGAVVGSHVFEYIGNGQYRIAFDDCDLFYGSNLLYLDIYAEDSSSSDATIVSSVVLNSKSSC